jgi:hypothetical protein
VPYLSKTQMRLVAISLVVAGVMLAYFSDNIRGYYRFKGLCETEGGLRVLHPLRRGVGWLGRKGDHSLAAFPDVAFLRYRDGAEFDVRYRSGLVSDERSYDTSPAHKDNEVTYELRWISESLPNEVRATRSCYEVREITTGVVMLRWCQIGYSTFRQDRTLLAAPSGQACYFAGDFFASENQPRYFVK